MSDELYRCCRDINEFGLFDAPAERCLAVVRWSVWSAGLVALGIFTGWGAACATGLVATCFLTILALWAYERAPTA